MDENVRTVSGVALLALVLLAAAAAVLSASRALAIGFLAGWFVASSFLLYLNHRLGTSNRFSRYLLFMWLGTSVCLATVPFYHLPE